MLSQDGTTSVMALSIPSLPMPSIPPGIWQVVGPHYQMPVKCQGGGGMDRLGIDRAIRFITHHEPNDDWVLAVLTVPEDFAYMFSLPWLMKLSFDHSVHNSNMPHHLQEMFLILKKNRVSKGKMDYNLPEIVGLHSPVNVFSTFLCGQFKLHCWQNNDRQRIKPLCVVR